MDTTGEDIMEVMKFLKIDSEQYKAYEKRVYNMLHTLGQ